MRDREALEEVNEALETAATRMAKVFCDSGVSDGLKEVIRKQWLRMAKIQVAIGERLESTDKRSEP